MEGIYDWAVLWEWVEIAARWTHVITAIAWIGSSFYFIALDLGLRQGRLGRTQGGGRVQDDAGQGAVEGRSRVHRVLRGGRDEVSASRRVDTLIGIQGGRL